VNQWTIYDRPKDYPDQFVARCWRISPGKLQPTGDMFTGDTLDEVRALLPYGLVRVTRYPDDDPKIVETWL